MFVAHPYRLTRAALAGLAVLAAGLALPALRADEDKKPAHSAVTPSPRKENKGWMARHEAFVKRAKKGDVDVVFLGDSITQGWEGQGKDVWKKSFEPLKAVNFGIGGDRTGHVLWRITAGKELEGIKPKAFVVMIGTNNTGDNSADEIAEGVEAIVRELRRQKPDAHVLLLGVFPRGKEAKDARWAKIKQVNTRISKLDDGKSIHYRDLGAKFLDKEGAVPKKLMPDYLHLSKEGYQIWADAIEKDLKALLKKPATADPPPEKPAAAAAEGLPTLIPRRVLFGNPVQTAPRISPDGKRLAYLAPDKDDVLQVWVRTVGKDDAVQVTKDKKRGIRIHQWTYHPDTLIYLQDADGDENFHVYAVNVKSKKTTDLTPYEGVRAQPLGTHRDFPDELLVGLNRRDPRVFDVYRVDLKTGKAELDTKNPGDVVGWSTDAKFRVRVAQAPTKDGGTELRLRKDDKSEWKKLLTWKMDDADGRVLSFTKDGKALWLFSSEGRDTLSLVKRDLEAGKEELIASDKNADAAGVILNPKTYEVEAVAFNRERLKWKALDKDIEADLKALEKGAAGEPSVVSTDKERKTWVVSYEADTVPAAYYLYDRATKKLTKLFVSRPELAKYTLAPMKPVTIKTRDGLELVSYLTLPVGVEAKKLPTVLLVHGGPWARDAWGFDAQAQWLANRGYAVLQVNYRGSTGFGKKFLHAGNREWAGKMHNDLIDAVNWAVKQGYADPKKVAIFGGSYGGYAALVGATFTPDVFACAVSVVGPSNLVTLLKSIPPYWEPMKRLFALRVGDLEKEEEFLKSRSPLFKADKIKIPMLIAQGANDPRVKQAESEQIVAAIKKAGKPVEYVLFKDEGHGFARPENRLKFMAIAEAFLAKHLGGRAEPAPKAAEEPEKK